jgi:hypothetical protein
LNNNKKLKKYLGNEENFEYTTAATVNKKSIDNFYFNSKYFKKKDFVVIKLKFKIGENNT